MKNLLMYAAYSSLKQLYSKNGNIFRSLLHYRKIPSNVVSSNACQSKKQTSEPNITLNRLYSTAPDRNKLQIMDFQKIIWPSIVKTIKNWIFSSLIIKPYFDQDFSLPDFVIGSKQALEIVSKKLSDGSFEDLQGLVTSDCLTEVQRSVSGLSVAQRQQLAISKEDIYFSFPYEVGIMFDDKPDPDSKQKRTVEITMVYHILRGYKEMIERGEQPPMNMGVVPEYKERIFICNYRFVREYTKGVSDQWSINIINHFKPGEYVN